MAELILLQLSKITLLEHNPRAIDDADIDQLCQDIEEDPEFLTQRPPLINQKGKQFICYAGQQRVKAFIKLGRKEIYVFMEKNVPKKVQDKRMVLDNTHRGRWDIKVLMNEYDFKVEELVGFGIPETSFNVYGKGEATEDNYEIPDEIQTDIKLGDLITIGAHRLLCGDSTKADDVAKLMGGGFANLMVTDPPYGVNYDADWRNHALRKNGSPSNGRAIGKVTNDDQPSWGSAYNLFAGNICYVWHGDRHAKTVQQNLEDAGFELIAQIIWAKNNIVIGRGDYHFKHEPCYYAVRKGKNHNWQKSRTENSLWEIDKPNKSETGHSTQKPIDCMAKPIQNNSKEGEGVYDPFIGSGTTMVACQQLDRICYAIEIEPKYCQVVIDRMLKSFPELEVKVNGKKYKEISAK